MVSWWVCKQEEPASTEKLGMAAHTDNPSGGGGQKSGGGDGRYGWETGRGPTAGQPSQTTKLQASGLTTYSCTDKLTACTCTNKCDIFKK